MSQSRDASRRAVTEVVDVIPIEAERTGLREHMGFVHGMGQRDKASRRAAAALDELDARRTRATVNVQMTAIAITEISMRQALILTAMAKLGALTVQANQSTSQAMSLLTSSHVAEMIMSSEITAQNHQLVMDGVRQGTHTPYQGTAMCAEISRMQEDDLRRARARMDTSKEALDRLAEKAIRGLDRAKDSLA